LNGKNALVVLAGVGEGEWQDGNGSLRGHGARFSVRMNPPPAGSRRRSDAASRTGGLSGMPEFAVVCRGEFALVAFCKGATDDPMAGVPLQWIGRESLPRGKGVIPLERRDIEKRVKIMGACRRIHREWMRKHLAGDALDRLAGFSTAVPLEAEGNALGRCFEGTAVLEINFEDNAGVNVAAFAAQH